MYRLRFPPAFVGMNGQMYLQSAILPGKHSHLLVEGERVEAVVAEGSYEEKAHTELLFEPVRLEFEIAFSQDYEKLSAIPVEELKASGFKTVGALVRYWQDIAEEQGGVFSQVSSATVIRFACVPDTMKELREWNAMLSAKERGEKRDS
jgi:hypothetical protein